MPAESLPARQDQITVLGSLRLGAGATPSVRYAWLLHARVPGERPTGARQPLLKRTADHPRAKALAPAAPAGQGFGRVPGIALEISAATASATHASSSPPTWPPSGPRCSCQSSDVLAPSARSFPARLGPGSCDGGEHRAAAWNDRRRIDRQCDGSPFNDPVLTLRGESPCPSVRPGRRHSA